MRRPSSLAPLLVGSSGSPLSSPDDANRPPPSLSNSGRFNFGHLQIDTQGVASSRDSGYSELSDSSGAFAAGAGAGAALDFGELQGLEIIGRGASGFVRCAAGPLNSHPNPGPLNSHPNPNLHPDPDPDHWPLTLTLTLS